MKTLSRRSFLTLGSRLAAALGLAGSAIPALAAALEKLAQGQARVLWLQGQCCSGCSVSLLNTEPITADRLLTKYVSMCYHQTLSTATGHTAVAAINQTIAQGDYLLVVEGAVPEAMPKACMINEEPFGQQVLRAVAGARAVVAVGACASHGGIPAAQGNPTGAVSVPAYLRKQGNSTPIVCLPGCPAHPDWIVGTLAHVLAFGLPPLDSALRPTVFYGRKVHDQCPRFADYEAEHFATRPGEPGCLFKVGCCGPITKADCSLRLWNGRTNFCINAGAPCIGCANPEFARQASYSLFLCDNAHAKPFPSKP